MNQGQRLAEISKMVRESSLKRFRQVQPPNRGWRPREDMLTFVDVLKHLVDADLWLFSLLEGYPKHRADIKPGEAHAADWDRHFAHLELLGKKRAEKLSLLSDEDLARPIVEPEILGDTDWGTLIMRGCLDHEAHHRGSLQVMLRLKYG